MFFFSLHLLHCQSRCKLKSIHYSVWSLLPSIISCVLNTSERYRLLARTLGTWTSLLHIYWLILLFLYIKNSCFIPIYTWSLYKDRVHGLPSHLLIDLTISLYTKQLVCSAIDLIIVQHWRTRFLVGGTQVLMLENLMATQGEYWVVPLSQLDHFALSHVARISWWIFMKDHHSNSSCLIGNF